MPTLVARLLPLLLLAASAPPLAPGDPGERGRALYELGRYAEAEPHLRAAVEAAERTRGPGDPATADALEALAELYWAQDRHAEAEPLLERAVAPVRSAAWRSWRACWRPRS